MESEPFVPLCGFLVLVLFVPTMEYSALENAMVATHRSTTARGVRYPPYCDTQPQGHYTN